MKKTLLQQRLDAEFRQPLSQGSPADMMLLSGRGEASSPANSEPQLQSHDFPSSTFTLHGGGGGSAQQSSKQDRPIFMSRGSNHSSHRTDGDGPETARLGAQMTQSTENGGGGGAFHSTALLGNESSGFERDIPATNKFLIEQNFRREPEAQAYQFPELDTRRQQPVRLSKDQRLDSSPILTHSPKRALEEYKQKRVTPRGGAPGGSSGRGSDFPPSPQRELIKRKIQKITTLRLPDQTNTTSSLLSLVPATVRDLSISRRCKADFDSKMDQHFNRLTAQRDIQHSLGKYPSESSIREEPRIMAKQSLQHGTFFNISSASKNLSPTQTRTKQYRPPRPPRLGLSSQKAGAGLSGGPSWQEEQVKIRNKTPSKRKVELQSQLESALKNFSSAYKSSHLDRSPLRSPPEETHRSRLSLQGSPPSDNLNRTKTSFLSQFPSHIKEPKVNFSSKQPSLRPPSIYDVLGFDEIYRISEAVACLSHEQALSLPASYLEEARKLGELLVAKFNGKRPEIKVETGERPERDQSSSRGSPGSRQRGSAE